MSSTSNKSKLMEIKKTPPFKQYIIFMFEKILLSYYSTCLCSQLDFTFVPLGRKALTNVPTGQLKYFSFA